MPLDERHSIRGCEGVFRGYAGSMHCLLAKAHDLDGLIQDSSGFLPLMLHV